MDDLIKSLEKSLLAFDEEIIKRKLTVKEKKQKENIKYEIYWVKFKKFKADFESLIFNDVKELANSLETPLLEKNIVLKNETHIKNSRRYFSPDLPIYMILSISNKSLSTNYRWQNAPFLLFKGNHENDTIELYYCNQKLRSVHDFIDNNVFGNPVVQLKIDKYKFNLLKPHIKKWLNRSVDRIIKNGDFVTNN
ncbi:MULTISPECIES: hypothetical protein [unclassified Sphingobacterium]|uniref:hypothetical protein n=1 Tax=unclassified Sphingobacterium TaxID=2609468 RepID=UPI00143B5986|nr:hypothetical protein [Sphingobacterium sp. B16(2022)]NJI74046.1 hypothetical protein [Sphingobacterium sp. B16(2022)]